MNYDDTAKFGLQGAQPQCSVRNESVGQIESETGSAKRPIVRIRSFTTRLKDTDNVCPKYLIDALRYCGAISDDREKDIILQVTQNKVAHLREEKTEVEIEYA